MHIGSTIFFVRIVGVQAFPPMEGKSTPARNVGDRRCVSMEDKSTLVRIVEGKGALVELEW